MRFQGDPAVTGGFPEGPREGRSGEKMRKTFHRTGPPSPSGRRRKEPLRGGTCATQLSCISYITKLRHSRKRLCRCLRGTQLSCISYLREFSSGLPEAFPARTRDAPQGRAALPREGAPGRARSQRGQRCRLSSACRNSGLRTGVPDFRLSLTPSEDGKRRKGHIQQPGTDSAGARP